MLFLAVNWLLDIPEVADINGLRMLDANKSAYLLSPKWNETWASAAVAATEQPNLQSDLNALWPVTLIKKHVARSMEMNNSNDVGQFILVYRQLCGLHVNLQGVPIKNNPLWKIHYLSYCDSFFSPNLQLSQRRIRTTYIANFVTIFAVV